MNSLPVLIRELRLQAKARATYSLRWLAAGLVTFWMAFLMLARGLGGTSNGVMLFELLQVSVVCCIWLLVPWFTADCLSREKREGTLGLLLLTNLRPWSIVVAKSLVHGLRALTVVAAVWPVMAIPLLLGGVGMVQVVGALLVQFGTLALALSAGLMASAVARLWRTSALLAALFSMAFFQIGNQVLWRSLLSSQIVFALFSGGVLVFAVVFSAACIGKAWREEPPSGRQLWWIQTFWSPRFWRAQFRRLMSRRLDHNPIRWLQGYSTGARLTKWIWCLLAVFFASCLLGEVGDTSWFLYFEGLWILSLAFTAAASFQREKENGALELILVSPIGSRQMISGRMAGVWSQYLPSLLILLIPLLFFLSYLHIGDASPLFGHICVLISTFATLPVIGLFCSLRLSHFLLAWLATLLTGFLLPFALAALLQSGPAMSVFELFSLWPAVILAQGVLGAAAHTALEAGVRSRSWLLGWK